MTTDYMVYDRRMIDGKFYSRVEIYNIDKIIHLEKIYGIDSIKNMIVFKKKRAFEEWESRTDGKIIDNIYNKNKKNKKLETKKTPSNLRKAGNSHKLIEWKYKNNII